VSIQINGVFVGTVDHPRTVPKEGRPALYKIVGLEGEPRNGGRGNWPLPHGQQPGEWREVEGTLQPCANGLHLTDADHITAWVMDGPICVVYRAEVDGELLDAGDKYVARRVRLLPRSKPVASLQKFMRQEERAASKQARRVRASLKRVLKGLGPGWSYYLTVAAPSTVKTLPKAIGEIWRVHLDEVKAATTELTKVQAQTAAARQQALLPD
jgi:hypothetical protein